MARLLLIDDDPAVLLTQVSHLFAPREIEITVARDGLEGLEEIVARKPDVVLLDVGLPDMPGLDVFRQIRAVDVRIPVIFVTGSSATDIAIEAMRQGAFDYLFKPIDLHQLERVVREAVEVSRRMRELAADGDEAPDGGDSIIGRSPAMLEVYKAIGRVADQKVVVLITGESGTGKELVARAIYHHSDRAKAPFLAINCAAIPESLLESEMFGHEKGAFTGADRRRIGKFEQCDGGTMLLDEIGDMPLATQAKLLRLLQDQKFERLGGSETIQTDVRLIAATNRDLKAWSEGAKFRSDLYYRLSVFTIQLPPLRERGPDLEILVRFYVNRFNRELGREVREVDPEAMDRLRDHHWPGNVRELQSVLKQALLRASGSSLLMTFLPDFVARGLSSDTKDPAQSADDMESFILRRLEDNSQNLHVEAHTRLDRLLLAHTLKFTNGNQVNAAKVLGIARQTLRNRLRELGINISKGIRGVDD